MTKFIFNKSYYKIDSFRAKLRKNHFSSSYENSGRIGLNTFRAPTEQ